MQIPGQGTIGTKFERAGCRTAALGSTEQFGLRLRSAHAVCIQAVIGLKLQNRIVCLIPRDTIDPAYIIAFILQSSLIPSHVLPQLFPCFYAYDTIRRQAVAPLVTNHARFCFCVKGTGNGAVDYRNAKSPLQERNHIPALSFFQRQAIYAPARRTKQLFTGCRAHLSVLRQAVVRLELHDRFVSIQTCQPVYQNRISFILQRLLDILDFRTQFLPCIFSDDAIRS